MTNLCTLEHRNRYAPNAISSIDEIRPGEYYFLLRASRIYRIRVEKIVQDEHEERFNNMVLRHHIHLGENYNPRDEVLLSDVGVVPYYKEEDDTWHDVNMLFHTLGDAIAVIQHKDYPRKMIDMKRALEYVRNLFPSKNSELPLERNPNF